MYGPLDMITLAGLYECSVHILQIFQIWYNERIMFCYDLGEKVDIHIMRDTPGGEWVHLSTEVTDKTGRVTYSIPEDKAVGYGLYPVKLVVRYVLTIGMLD